MPRILNVPFSRQQNDGFCLLACAQMGKHHLGISRSQQVLARQLNLIKGAGVPATNIVRLNSSSLTVTCETGTMNDISRLLDQQIPIIVSVQAGELPYHGGRYFKHAVIVVGIEEQTVYLLDPDAEIAPISSSFGDFLLVWYEMDNRYAVITKRR